MKAVVLAAGKGVRLRPLTNDRPKALVELKGKPLLQWVLERLQEAGVKEVGLIVGWKGEMVREKFGEEFNGMKLEYIEQPQALGTAHAISLAQDFVREEGFICTYTDVIAESGAYSKLVKEFGAKEKDIFSEGLEKSVGVFDAVVVGRDVEDTWRYGVLKVKGNRVEEIVEKPSPGEEPSKIINAGIYWLSGKIFGAIAETMESERGELEITDSLAKFAEKGRLGFLHYRGKCIDISSEEDIKEAEKELDESGKKPAKS